MIKDIHTIDGWYSDGKVTLLRNDRKQIPINLDYVNKGFTWYNGSEYYQEEQDTPIDPGNTTPIQPDPQPGDNPQITTYTITTSNSGGGSISTNSTEVEFGGSAIITITVNSGYQLTSLRVNGINVTEHIVNNKYTITNITENKIVYASFSIIQQDTPDPEPEPQDTSMHIYYNVGSNGKLKLFIVDSNDRSDSLLVEGNQDVFGSNDIDHVKITAIPNTGYRISNIAVNGQIDPKLSGGRTNIYYPEEDMTIDCLFESASDGCCKMFVQFNEDGSLSYMDPIDQQQKTITTDGYIYVSKSSQQITVTSADQNKAPMYTVSSYSYAEEDNQDIVNFNPQKQNPLQGQLYELYENASMQIQFLNK